MEKKILRIVDANYNRTKEALRVVEDLLRFLWEDKSLTRKLKHMRHNLTEIFNRNLFNKMISQRDSQKDIGKTLDSLELKRRDIKDILFANLQRAKESVRVLEEISKIINKNSVCKLKKMRYNLYSLEKNVEKKYLHNNR